MEIQDLSGAALAYLGDAVLEIMTRKRLLQSGLTHPKDLNREALRYVRATAQSAAVERILPLLDEAETDVYRRGRNASGLSVPKSADTATYRRATGMEALFGWLYLSKDEKRAEELFRAAYEEKGE